MLVRVVLVRSTLMPLTVRVSEPLLPMTEPPATRSTASTMKVVGVFTPAFRISTLFRVVLVRSRPVPLLTTVSTPPVPTMVPPDARSA